MANVIYPKYAPPVNSVKVRELWEKGIGVKGVLSEFEVTDDGISVFMSDGAIISDSCVVDVRSHSIDGIDVMSEPVYLYGRFDSSSGDGVVEVSSTPIAHWVLIAYKWGGEWVPSSGITTYELWIGAGSHAGSDDLHLTQNEYDAISAEPSASPLNTFLTENDIESGIVYSPSDISIYPLGVGGKNESGVVIDVPPGNIISGCAGNFESGAGADGSIGNIRSALFAVEASGRYFEDTFRPPLESAGFSFQNAMTNTIEDPSPVSSHYYTLEIMEPVFEAIASVPIIGTYEDERQFGSKVLGLMFFAEDPIDSIRIHCATTSGSNEETTISAPDTGKWISLSLSIPPGKSNEVVGTYVAIKGAKYDKVRITDLYRSPVIKIGPMEASDDSVISSIRIAQLAGERSDVSKYRYYVEKIDGEEFAIDPFVNHKVPEDLIIDAATVSVVMASSGGLVSATALEWPRDRSDYIMTNTDSTGSCMVIGGTGPYDVTKADSYSPLGDFMSVPIENINIKCNKSAVAEFGGLLFITGGDHSNGSDMASVVDSSSMTLQARNPIPTGKQAHGSCSVDAENAYVWGGTDERLIYSYNNLSDSWTTMPEIISDMGIGGGSRFSGAKLHARELLLNDDADNPEFDSSYQSSGCIIVGAGLSAGSCGGKIDLATFSYSSLGTDNLVAKSNVTVQKYGVAVYQSETTGDVRTGCMDIFSGTERKIEVPTTGRGNSGNSLHRNGKISYGPFKGIGGYVRTHNTYSYMTPCWINGIAAKWEETDS